MRKGWKLLLAVLAIAVIVLAVTGLIASTSWLKAYIRGEEFLGLVAKAAGNAFGAEARFAPLVWSGTSVFTESVSLVGSPTSSLRMLNAAQLRANVNVGAVVSGAWRINEISVAEIDGEWQKTPPRPSARTTAATPRRSSGLRAWLPARFELGILDVTKARIRYENIVVSDAALKVTQDRSAWIFDGRGGKLATPWMPELGIGNFRVRMQGEDFYLTRANLAVGARGKISLAGESARGGALRATWEDVDLRDVVKGHIGKYLSGTLSGNAEFGPGNIKGTAALREGKLENVSSLAVVAEFTGNPAFRRMPIQEMRGDFALENGGWKIENFSAESQGLLKVEGSGVIGRDRSLRARLQVGVTAQTLRWIPGSREQVFNSPRDGYLWTEVLVGGTLEQPTENLSSRLMGAMGKAIIGTGAGVIKDGAPTIESVPGTAIEGVKGLLDVVRPFVP